MEAKAASEFARLRKFQAGLEEETGNACFVGLSIVGTAQQCIKLGNLRAANQVQSEFRISDRRFCWLKVSCLQCVLIWGSQRASEYVFEQNSESFWKADRRAQNFLPAL